MAKNFASAGDLAEKKISFTEVGHDLWAFTGEMFHSDRSDEALISGSIASDPESPRAAWQRTVTDVLSVATLEMPTGKWMQKGGRTGHHTEHLGHLLSELQSMQRTFPGATW